MGIARHRQAQRPLQENLARRGSEQVRSPHHLCHALRRIVDYCRQVIRNLAVSPPDDEVAGLQSAILTVVVLDDVNELNRSLIGLNRKAEGMRAVDCGGVVTTSPRIDRFGARFGDLRGGERGAAAPARVGTARIRNLSQGVGIKLRSMGLEANISIPLEAELLQRCLELPGQPRQATVTIEVVDPEQPAATLVARVQVAAGSGQQRAEV